MRIDKMQRSVIIIVLMVVYINKHRNAFCTLPHIGKPIDITAVEGHEDFDIIGELRLLEEKVTAREEIVLRRIAFRVGKTGVDALSQSLQRHGQSDQGSD